MGAFAAFLKRGGIAVTGSDQNIYPPMSDVLQQAGVVLFSGYSAENLNLLGGRPDLVVIGNVIRSDNPEARAAIDGGYDYASLPEAMERLLLQKTRNLVIAGTHGKTTTSSMLAHVLTSAKKNPNYFIGGVSQDLPFSFQLASTDPGSYFVLEGDEYDTAFWDKVPKFNHYLPDDAVLTSVEFDHADIYPDFGAVVRAFEGLVDRIRPGGSLIACTDYPAVRDLCRRSKARVTTYGTTSGTGPSGGGHFTSSQIRHESGLTFFEVRQENQLITEIALQVPGQHNVLNALAVWILCRQLGLPEIEIRRGLASFRGVKRRQEVRGDVREVTVIDDFAHHPTAVRETLRALRQKYVGRRLISVFEPRSATSRRKIFQKEFAESFLLADACFVATPFDQSRIPTDQQFSSQDLAQDVERKGGKAKVFSTVEEGVSEVARFCQKGDVVAVLSNGGFGGFIPKLIEALQPGSV